MSDLYKKDVVFIDCVRDEIEYARSKFPDSVHALAALTEEVGELAQAMLQHRYEDGDEDRIYEEAVQVAVMAMRIATEGDRSFSDV